MKPEAPVVDGGLLSISDEAWEQARCRAAVIGPLAAAGSVSHGAADAAGEQLGLSRRQVYVLVQRCRKGSGLVSDLAPRRSTGGRGGGRLPEAVEAVIRELVRTGYLTRQRLSLAVVYRDIARACKAQGLSAPARNTVTRRIAVLHPAQVAQSREGAEAVRSLRAAGGTVPAISAPLEQVQIDHTVIDVIVVDERDRMAIGRPYLTMAIDVCSRCVVGLVVTLEAPSAVSVGLCLAHVCCDKRPWLDRLGVEVDWPMGGKPAEVYLDNAAEFHSEALGRGCEQHGIALAYRPPGQPHYGGIVERVIGTAMARVHELPGTTFASPAQRGAYDAEGKAALTLRELERWLTLAVATYHGSVHGGLEQTPAGRWAEGVATTGTPPVLTNPTAFLVDFLPVIRRTLTRTGFVIDHVHYFANALKPWIARRDRLGKFIIRRDPRDISRVWVLEPEGHHYLEIPYRTLSHPPVTLWEHRQAVERLRRQGRDQVDEQALFAMIDQMRDITRTAKKATAKSRRDRERRQHLGGRQRSGQSAPDIIPEGGPPGELSPVPFDVEEW
ncbi:MAG: Mu transposase C-terminal domain-containing protein [Pseudonocardiaceae bacterium]